MRKTQNWANHSDALDEKVPHRRLDEDGTHGGKKQKISLSDSVGQGVESQSRLTGFLYACILQRQSRRSVEFAVRGKSSTDAVTEGVVSAFLTRLSVRAGESGRGRAEPSCEGEDAERAKVRDEPWLNQKSGLVDECLRLFALWRFYPARHCNCVLDDRYLCERQNLR